MNIYEAINSRRTVRDFSDEQVDKTVLLKIIEAGLKAPTHNHLREWEFIIIDDLSRRIEIINTENSPDTLDSYRNFLNDLEEKTAFEMYSDAIPKQKKMLLTAPVLMAVCYKTAKPVSDCTTIFELNNLASIWCCIENMLLVMAAENLYGVPYIPSGTINIKKFLNIPDNYEIAVLLALGNKSQNCTEVAQKEIDVTNKIHFNSYNSTKEVKYGTQY